MAVRKLVVCRFSYQKNIKEKVINVTSCPTLAYTTPNMHNKFVNMLYQVVNLVLYYVLLGIYLRGKGTPGMFDPVL